MQLRRLDTTRLRERWPLVADGIEWTRDASHRLDQVGVRLYAAAIAYRTIFSLIAFLSTFVLAGTLIGINAADLRESAPAAPQLVAADDTSDTPAAELADLGDIARDRAARTYELGSTPAWVAGLLGLALGLYGMAGGFAAICDVLDRIHGTHRYRRLTLRYVRGAGVAFVFVVLVLVAVVTLALSTTLGEFVLSLVGLDELEGLVAVLLGIVVPSAAILLAFGFVLRYGSHARPPGREVVIGAVVAGGAWLLLFQGFLVAAVLFKPFQAYGTFATSIALLLFGYLQAYLLIVVALFGPELVWLATFGRTRLETHRTQQRQNVVEGLPEDG